MKIKQILIIALIGMCGACNTLDVLPPNFLKDSDIFTSESGVTAYLTRLYSELPIEDFKYRRDAGFNVFESFFGLGINTGEYIQADYVRNWDTNSGFGYWPYGNIRNANYFIQTLPKYASYLQESDMKAWLGEAYFCRAYYYFGLVKRYGGVPIVTKPQDPYAPLDSLQVPRNKEVEVYDFISNDLQKAIDYLPETSVAGRANKYVAAALKSRAMLFAGSIAKYGANSYVGSDAQVKGLVGIPAERAQDFFQQSYDAAKLLEGKYSLYNVNPDKAQNYQDLFLDENSKENIFIKQYVYMESVENSRHSWDALNSPQQMTNSYGACMTPTLDLVELFGEVKVNDDAGNPIRFDKRSDLLASLTPRQRAVAYYPGEELRGIEIDIQAGLFTGNYTPTAVPRTATSTLATYTDKATGIKYRIMGLSGMGDGSTTRSGLIMKKYMNYKMPLADVNLWKSTQHWIDMRYAEVLLNRAEAAYELGTDEMKADALTQINAIRDRGGDKLFTMNDLTIDEIRMERRRELCFENQTWWDLRRWRIADKVINNTQYHALYPYYIIKEGKYIFKKDLEFHKAYYTFGLQQYYEPIPGGEINMNPNLLPNNPLY
ncbi:MAG: RagB/SusD family nutrient uptake outer membrane protein [Bacteroidota bacterium]|nr:RagB/SusD family nutrient uptake outer membrane protein [Bacteroidota bacterium]